LICGNDGVGKESIVKEWMKKKETFKFESEEDKSFYKIYYFSYEHKSEDINIYLTLEIRVLNGDELETDLKINMPFYKNAYGAFIVTDINEYITFQDAVKWKEKVDLLCCLPNRFPLPVFLLMNKCDLKEKEKRRPWMEENEIESYIQGNQYVKHYFTTIKEHEVRISRDSTSSVDIENPLREMIDFVMKFKDIKNDFIESNKSDNINVTQINELKKKESKSKCLII